MTKKKTLTMLWDRDALEAFVRLLNTVEIPNDVVQGTILGPWTLEEDAYGNALLTCGSYTRDPADAILKVFRDERSITVSGTTDSENAALMAEYLRTAADKLDSQELIGAAS